MADTTNYTWTKPVVNASRNTWGTITNAAWDAADASLKVVDDKAIAAQAAADALDTRVDALEDDVPTGYANWRSGQWYFPPACQGLNLAVTVLDIGRRYLVPFHHTGVFSGFGFTHSGPGCGYTCQVLDSTVDGAPGDILFSGTQAGSLTTDYVVSINPPITIVRPAWLTIRANGAGQIYMRGGEASGSASTLAPPIWALGCNAFRSASAANVPTVIYGDSAPYTPTVVGNSGENWSLLLGLQSY